MENYISRTIEDGIKNNLFKGKVIILYGAKQIEKATLAKKEFMLELIKTDEKTF